MNKRFMDFLLKDANGWDTETRKNIAKMLKKDPEQLKRNIMEQIMDWAAIYCMQSGTHLRGYTSTDADELMDAWRELLKVELEQLAGQ